MGAVLGNEFQRVGAATEEALCPLGSVLGPYGGGEKGWGGRKECVFL